MCIVSCYDTFLNLKRGFKANSAWILNGNQQNNSNNYL